MTTLDKQALENAIDSWDTRRMSIEERVQAVVNAYLEALPEARRVWIEGGLHEIREVRDA